MRLSLTLFFPHFCSDLDKTKGQVTLNLLFLLYYQCKNPSIIVRQHNPGASKLQLEENTTCCHRRLRAKNSWNKFTRSVQKNLLEKPVT